MAAFGTLSERLKDCDRDLMMDGLPFKYISAYTFSARSKPISRR